MPVCLYQPPLCPSHVPLCEHTHRHMCAACLLHRSEPGRLLPQTRTVFLNNRQKVMVQVSGLHTTVRLIAHGPRTRSLGVQPCGHMRTRSRCLVVALLTVISSHVVTRGHSPQSVATPSHVLHVGGCPVAVCRPVVTRGDL